MIKVEGLYGIYATVLADSISESGIRLLTFEISYPRIILAEYNTHRMLSKNSASSRAIPFAKMKEQLTGRPVRFGEANPGMQDKGEDHDALVVDPFETVEFDGNTGAPAYFADEAWEKAKEAALGWSEAFYKAGFHKQVYNRLTEPFQMMKTVVTGTEFGNFFWLRDHEAADPTIHELARCMREARELSKPVMLKAGQWHLPYLSTIVGIDGIAYHYLRDEDVGTAGYLTTEEAIQVSAARCAAVSFRNVDYGLEKSYDVHQRLVGDDRKHASALEHQATPMAEMTDPLAVPDDFNAWVNVPACPDTWEDGISHMDRDGNLWSGNFKGWIQYRKLIPGENYVEEE